MARRLEDGLRWLGLGLIHPDEEVGAGRVAVTLSDAGEDVFEVAAAVLVVVDYRECVFAVALQ